MVVYVGIYEERNQETWLLVEREREREREIAGWCKCCHCWYGSYSAIDERGSLWNGQRASMNYEWANPVLLCIFSSVFQADVSSCYWRL
jgi:hypothetical protein